MYLIAPFAITNSLCFKDKTCALTRRAIPIHPVNARAMIMVKRPGFITINSKITINKYGIPYNTSIPRIIHSSINVPRRLRPLTYPLNPPISTPSPISRAMPLIQLLMKFSRQPKYVPIYLFPNHLFRTNAHY